MTIVCFISGSGTNYREIVKRNPNHNYIVFTNRPDCGGVAIARENKHQVIELSHIPYLRDVRKKYGTGNVPQNCPERIQYEQDLSHLIEDKIGKQPDLICLAGFDQWNTDWMINRYYPRMLNVHPGDTTRDYIGLHWIPTAMAILAGDKTIRSTLFIADKSKDKGPVLVQSRPLGIIPALTEIEANGQEGLLNGLQKINRFVSNNKIKTYEAFKEKADAGLARTMEQICQSLMEALKVKGDWKIYPFAVHDLIAKGRVAVDDRTVYVDDKQMPEYGYRLD
jgi:folate-dependent phosphoribosylglycinamide formyltransferase PurN